MNWIIARSADCTIRIRREMEKYSESGLYPFRIELFWDIQDQESKEEEDMVDKLQENLSAVMEENDTALMVAIFQNDKNYVFTWYTKDMETFGKLSNQTLRFFPKLPIRIYSTDDANWEEYKKMVLQLGE
ncbi:MAG: DUF695 domain-containing protein, partial [Paludibacteraceae bacterium]